MSRASFMPVWCAVMVFTCFLVAYTLGGEGGVNPFTEKCYDQGILYSDSNYTNCECFNCFSGSHCSNLDPACAVDCSGGNPTMAQEYWEKKFTTLSSADTNTLAYYRAPYQLQGGIIPPAPYPAYQVDQYVRTAIYNIHEMVGNAEYTNAYIVYGQGCTQLINAAAYALAAVNNKRLPVFAQVPYYDQYQTWAEFNVLNNYWNASLEQTSEQNDIIEFVTSPNNPTGDARAPYYKNSSSLVYDMVYYWPSWTNITVKASHDIMLFSLSKLTGHAGTRFGWALVKNKEVAASMRSFINIMNIHTSMDTIHRAIRILDFMVEEKGEFFNWMSRVMASRYARILPLFENQPAYTLESVTSPPTWFYLWIKCNQSSDCYKTFKNAGVKGEAGSSFGASDEYMRIQLTLRSVDFELLYSNMKALLKPSQRV